MAEASNEHPVRVGRATMCAVHDVVAFSFCFGLGRLDLRPRLINADHNQTRRRKRLAHAVDGPHSFGTQRAAAREEVDEHCFSVEVSFDRSAAALPSRHAGQRREQRTNIWYVVATSR